jgi:hypothetical protein
MSQARVLASGSRLLVGLAAGIVGLAVLAPAAPAKKPSKRAPQARFLLSVSGSQTTTFNRDLPPDCVGSSREDITFATPSPVKVTVVIGHGEGASAPVFNVGKVPPNGFGDQLFTVNAKVHRAQTYTSSSGCRVYDYTGNCDVTAQAGWPLNLLGSFTADNVVGLVTDDAAQGVDALEQSCPTPVYGYGGLLPFFPRLHGGRGYLPEKLLFKAKRKKVTSHGGGSAHGDPIFGDSFDTTSDWTVELTRLK